MLCSSHGRWVGEPAQCNQYCSLFFCLMIFMKMTILFWWLSSGPGGPVPYRIYVDCGVIFLCVVGLAPACPLIAPAAMACYLVFIPMLRWLVIFTYRPQFDGGGLRWPFLHNILISSMIWSQVSSVVRQRTKTAIKYASLDFLSKIHFDCVYRFSSLR